MDAEAEAQRIELWHLDFFLRLGFSGDQISVLLSWRVDPHDALRLLYRDGERTVCTHEQAMRILAPDLVPV